ncbi:calcium-binding protein [Mesorhizobium cantuariense]|uniref:Calcium-binding protein n=1 Tax=Mesorhizobium cantuariense TaxID=1300275 RepID=A0ABV7MIY5_9HYPH
MVSITYLPDTSKTMELEIGSWQALGLPPSSYAGNVLAWFIGEDVPGASISFGDLLTMIKAFGQSLLEVEFSGDYIHYNGIDYSNESLVNIDGILYILKDVGQYIPIGITDAFAFFKFFQLINLDSPIVDFTFLSFGLLFGPAALVAPLLNIFHDPLILDLGGDGIHLSPLAGSPVHFDYDGDGFAERTGWVSADDGILVVDANGNGVVDGVSELFGSSTQDGFAVLETFDTNGDGRIDASDSVFSTLRVWQDLDQDGVSDAGEMMTLAEAGIVSIALTRTDVTGANAGHDLGYEALFTRANGTTGTAQTIYFQTDRQDTRADNTPNFTLAEGVDKLPQLPGSGQINSIAWMATQDAAFKADWTALTDAAATLSPEQLRSAFEDLLLRWASVGGIAEGTRGQYVDAQHLAFVEKFFGVAYKEIYTGQQLSTSPTTQQFGANIEASFDQIVDVMLTAFLAQTAGSTIARGGDLLGALESPYFFYALLDFRHEWPAGTEPPETPGNVGMVLDLIKGMMPEATGAAASYLVKTISGLEGVVPVAFEGDRTAYLTTANTVLSTIADHDLRLIATEIAGGTAALGTDGADGMVRTDGDNVFVGGKGDDLLVSGAGSDLFVYTRGDGTDYIRDSSMSLVEKDTLFLTNLAATDLTFERIGNDLILKISGSIEKIVSEDFFANWGAKNLGIDQIRFADGSLMDRETIRSHTTTVGDGRDNLVQDTALNDVLQGGKGDDEIRIGTGSDTILYAAGDGFDVINDTSGIKTEIDRLVLANMMPSDVELSRVGNALTIKILATGEFITDQMFFYQSGAPNQLNDWSDHGWGIDRIQFASGAVWDRQTIVKEAWIRGNDNANGLYGSAFNDTFTSGHGNDTMDGGVGADIYVWKKGDGSDYISDNINNLSDADRLILADVYVSDVKFSYNGDSLQITVGSSGEVISVGDFFAYTDNLVEDWAATAYGVDQITFAGGTTLNRQQIFDKTGEDYLGRDFWTWSEYVNGNLQWAYFTDEFGNSGHIVGSGPIGVGDNDVFSGYVDAQGNDNYNNVFHEVAGHNSVTGGSGDDFFTGGAGNDSLVSRGGNDILFGDAPLAGYGSSVTPDAAGNDYLDGGAGDDLLYGGNGNDTLMGGAGTDQLIGGDGSDTLMDSGVENDTFDGGKGDDFIQSGVNSSDNGDDTFLYALGDGNDVISDSAVSLTEIDRLVLSDINSDEVELSFGGTSLVIRMLQTNETITGVDFIYIDGTTGSGIDRIEFANGVAWNRAQMRSHAEASWLRGTSSRDFLQNDNMWNQTFDGGQGDDVIASAASYWQVWDRGLSNGNDTFIYRHGDGNDFIVDGSHSTTEVDTLRLIDIDSDDVELSRVGDDLLVKDLVTGQIITNARFYWSFSSTNHSIDRIEFADGVVWDRAAMLAKAWYRGTNTNDTLQSGQDTMDDTFIGGIGDDIHVSAPQNWQAYNPGGMNGNDTYIYNLGDGNDLIVDGSRSLQETDTLVLNGINPEDVALSTDGYNLYITIVPTGQRITDEGAFWGRPDVGRGLERLVFADGTVWNREDIRFWAQEGSAFFAGGTGDETLIGSYLDQRIEGGRGNDFIDGKGGSDLIFGDIGNDTLALTIADPGDVDALDGGAGTDTATFQNFGAAIHVDLVENQGEAKTSDGPSLQVGSLRLVATLRGLENIIGTAFNDEIHGDSADNQLVGGAGDDFLDGRSGNDALSGGLGNDTLDGYLGNDTLVGGAGDDALTGGLGNDLYDYTRGDGNDAIFETIAETGSNDRIRLHNVDPAKVSVSRLNGGLVLEIAESAPGAGDASSLTVTGPQNGIYHYDQYGVETIEFDNGVIWNADFLRQMSVSDSATDGDDVLVGSPASGIMHGGKGNDSLSGGTGDDSYVYARGDGNDAIVENTSGGGNDRLAFSDINSAAVTLVRNGNDVRVVIAESAPAAGDGGSVLLKDTLADYYGQGVENIVFADGTIWTRADMNAHISYVGGTAGNETITGTAGNDDMRAGLGDDLLVGQAGNDSYTYILGDGNDVINEVATGTDVDTLILDGINQTDVRFERPYNDLSGVVMRVLATGQTITLDNQFDQEGGVEKIVFDDGSVLGGNDWSLDGILTGLASIYGTANAETISGTSGNDRLVGKAGNDTLSGAGGDDTYVYARGDGKDTITEGTNGGSNDQLVFSDINPSAVSLVRSGNDVTVVIAESTPGAGDGGSVLLKESLNDYYGQGVDKVVFADGTIWTRADLLEQVSTTVSYSSNSGSVSVDLALQTAVVNNPAMVGQFVRLYQTNGNYLSLAEVQVFESGQNVALTGTASQKTTGWGGDASRAIDGNTDGNFNHNSVTHTGTPNVGEWWQVDLGRAATIDQIVIFNRADYSNRLGDFDVVVTNQELSSTATLQDAISQPGAQVVHYTGTFPLSDTVFALSETETLTNIKHVTGTASDDTLLGNASANTLLGGYGNDVIEGRGGQDLLSGGAGNDTFIFRSNFGLDNITDFVTGMGSDDTVQFADTVFDDFASVLAAATQVGADTVITHDPGNVLTLKNVALANLHQDDFQFIAA